jgi:hypothetical protein
MLKKPVTSEVTTKKVKINLVVSNINSILQTSSEVGTRDTPPQTRTNKILVIMNTVKKSAKKAVETAVVIADIKGIELSSTEHLTLASQIAEAERNVEANCYAAHIDIVEGYVAVGKSIIALRALVDANLANLGNFTSFKQWLGDRKFGARGIGYKQCTLYVTIAKHPNVARKCYDAGAWSLNALAAAVNEETGNVKSGGRKAADKTVAESEGDAADVVESTGGVTSLEAVLAFIRQANIDQLRMIAAVGGERANELGGL